MALFNLDADSLRRQFGLPLAPTEDNAVTFLAVPDERVEVARLSDCACRSPATRERATVYGYARREMVCRYCHLSWREDFADGVWKPHVCTTCGVSLANRTAFQVAFARDGRVWAEARCGAHRDPEPPTNIAIVNDAPSDAELIARILEQTHALVSAPAESILRERIKLKPGQAVSRCVETGEVTVMGTRGEAPRVIVEGGITADRMAPVQDPLVSEVLGQLLALAGAPPIASRDESVAEARTRLRLTPNPLDVEYDGSTLRTCLAIDERLRKHGDAGASDTPDNGGLRRGLTTAQQHAVSAYWAAKVWQLDPATSEWAPADPLDAMYGDANLRWLINTNTAANREDPVALQHRKAFTPAQREAVSAHHSAELRAKVAASAKADKERERSRVTVDCEED